MSPDHSRGESSAPHLPRANVAGSFDRRKFEHISSISRSSGLEPDGDTYVNMVYVYKFLGLRQMRRLKDFAVQEQYREFLQQKVMHRVAHGDWRWGSPC